MDRLTIFSDADWAGDKVSRKSTTGGCLMIGDHLLKGAQAEGALEDGQAASSHWLCRYANNAATGGAVCAAERKIGRGSRI